MNQDINYKIKVLADTLIQKGLVIEGQEVYGLTKEAAIPIWWIVAGVAGLLGGGTTVMDIYNDNYDILDRLLKGSDMSAKNLRNMEAKELDKLFSVYRNKLSNTNIVGFPSGGSWPKDSFIAVDEFFTQLSRAFYDDNTNPTQLTEGWFEEQIELAFKKADAEDDEPTFLDDEAFWAKAFKAITALRISALKAERNLAIENELGRRLSSEERRAAIHEFSRGQRKEDASAVASRIKREPVSSRQESPKKDPPLKETQLLPPTPLLPITPSNKPKPKAKAPEAKPAMKPEDNFIGK